MTDVTVEASKSKVNPQASLPNQYASAVLGGINIPRGEGGIWREIYTPLLSMEEKSAATLLAVSSPRDNEGKTTVALGLARAMAEDLEKQILLIDCNLFRPTLSEAFEKKRALGLTDYLAGNILVLNVFQPTGYRNLWYLTSGRQVPNPSRSYRSSAMVKFLRELRAGSDIVVLDFPAILTCSDTRWLLPYIDALLLVVRTGVSTTYDVQAALAVAESVRRRGIVLNDFHSSVPKRLRQFVLGR